MILLHCLRYILFECAVRANRYILKSDDLWNVLGDHPWWHPDALLSEWWDRV